MLHEVPDQPATLQEVYSLLKRSAHFLLVEPRGHVSEAAFQATLHIALSTGFEKQAERKIRLSRAVILRT
jgi:hypothetical protein